MLIPNFDSHWDAEMPRECSCCGAYFDTESATPVVIEVDDYSECLDCLKTDPEILAELKVTHPHLFSE